MEKEKVLAPIYYYNGKPVCTPITSAYYMTSQANVQLTYGSHSKPVIIEIYRHEELLQTGQDKMRVPEEDREKEA